MRFKKHIEYIFLIASVILYIIDWFSNIDYFGTAASIALIVSSIISIWKLMRGQDRTEDREQDNE